MTNRQLDLFITLSASDVVTKHSRDLMEDVGLIYQRISAQKKSTTRQKMVIGAELEVEIMVLLQYGI